MPLTRRAAITVATALAALATGACSSGPDSAGPALPGDAVVAPAASAIAPGAPAAHAAPAAGADWPTYHGDNARTGFSAGTPRLGTLATAWATHLDGAVYASPVVVAGTAVVATENDSVYGLDAATGTIRWRQHLATPAPLSALPCGNVDPLGITGTPAYDAVTGRVFVVTTRLAGRRLAHELVGLDPRTGAVRLRRGADPAGQDPTVQNQRGALAVSRGVVYVPYGGHAGDCGDYHGTVVGLRADGKGSLSSYRVPTHREAGIWAPSGVAVDARGGLYVAVGNGAAGQDAGQRDAAYDQSDSVTKLSAALRRTSVFAPPGWRQENSVDADLGSTGPLLIGSYVWAQGKASTGYVLHQDRQGGIGGAVSSVHACDRQFGGAAAHGMTVFASCTDGVRQVLISPSGRAVAGWRAPAQVSGSPVVGGDAVFSLDPDAGVLYALDERSGRVRSQLPVGPVTRFATPALTGGLLLVPTRSGVSAVAGA